MAVRDEQYLIEAFRRGDNSAFKEIFESINHSLVGWIRNQFLMNVEESEDVAADVWIKVYGKRDSLTSIEHIKRLAYVIARNKCIDIIRERPKHKEFSSSIRYLSSETEDEPEEDPKEVLAEKLKAAIRKIGGKRAKAINLYFFKNKTTPEVAKALGISTQTALNHKTNGINLLKGLLSDQGDPRKKRGPALKKVVEAPVDTPVVAELPEPVSLPVYEDVPVKLSDWVYKLHLTELMTQFKAGEKGAFRYIYDLYNAQFWAFALGLERHEPPEDIVAECWYRIFHKREMFNDPQHVRNYGFMFLKFYGINMAIQKNKEQKAAEEREAPIYEDYPTAWDNKLNWEQLSMQIREVLKRMSRRLGAKVLELQFFHDMEVKEIVEYLGVSRRAVYKQRSIALEKLKEELQPYKPYLIC